LAFRKDLISADEVEQILDDLTRAKFRIDLTVYRSVIKELKRPQPNSRVVQLNSCEF